MTPEIVMYLVKSNDEKWRRAKLIFADELYLYASGRHDVMRIETVVPLELDLIVKEKTV